MPRKIKKTFYAYGNIDFGIHNFIEFNGQKIDAYSTKQARFLLSKELHETTFKKVNRQAIYKNLSRVKFSTKRLKSLT